MYVDDQPKPRLGATQVRVVHDELCLSRQQGAVDIVSVQPRHLPDEVDDVHHHLDLKSAVAARHHVLYLRRQQLVEHQTRLHAAASARVRIPRRRLAISEVTIDGYVERGVDEQTNDDDDTGPFEQPPRRPTTAATLSDRRDNLHSYLFSHCLVAYNMRTSVLQQSRPAVTVVRAGLEQTDD